MEERFYKLIENRTIVKENGCYQLAEAVSQNQVPDTIQGIIAARMDRLEDNLKTTLQGAAVIGRSFHFKLGKPLRFIKKRWPFLTVIQRMANKRNTN